MSKIQQYLKNEFEPFPSISQTNASYMASPRFFKVKRLKRSIGNVDVEVGGRFYRIEQSSPRSRTGTYVVAYCQIDEEEFMP